MPDAAGVEARAICRAADADALARGEGAAVSVTTQRLLRFANRVTGDCERTACAHIRAQLAGGGANGEGSNCNAVPAIAGLSGSVGVGELRAGVELGVCAGDGDGDACCCDCALTLEDMPHVGVEEKAASDGVVRELCI